jgi:hypothetical protein
MNTIVSTLTRLLLLAVAPAFGQTADPSRQEWSPQPAPSMLAQQERFRLGMPERRQCPGEALGALAAAHLGDDCLT